MRIALLFVVSCMLFQHQTFAQSGSTSPYEWDWTRDGIWTGAALGGSAAGFLLIQNKDGFTEQEVADFRANPDVNFIDDWATGNFDEDLSTISDIPFYTSFVIPFALLFDDEMNDHTGQVLGMYVQSMATTGALFTITAGLTNRARPYVYSPDLPLDEALESTATRSFFSGHVAASATATFFAAKVFSDFNPDSKLKPYIWTAAISIPAAVGALRIESGQHFLTDVVLGYAIGAAAGYFIPEMHKTSNDTGLSIDPVMGFTPIGEQYQGMGLSLKF
jgi:membrane-associated phospholipid phosphatase